MTVHRISNNNVVKVSSDGIISLPDGSVVADKLAPNSVTSEKIVNGAVTSEKILNGTITDIDINGLANINPSKVAGTAVVNNDFRLSDSRTPTAHAASHAAGGTDAISPESIGAVSMSQIGNLLTANVATGTDTLGTTEGFTVAASEIVSSTDMAHTGTRSLRFNRISTGQAIIGAGGYLNSGSLPVTEGVPFTATVQVASTKEANMNLRVYWFMADGVTSAGARAQSSSPVILPTFQELRVVAVPPAGARFASLVVASVANVFGAGDYIYTDTWGFWQGAGGFWSASGNIIYGTNWLWDETVGRRRFEWDTINSRWQMTYGDTGWRAVASGAPNTDGIWYVRRQNDTVTISTSAVNLLSGWTSGNSILQLIPGFAPRTSYLAPGRYSQLAGEAQTYNTTLSTVNAFGLTAPLSNARFAWTWSTNQAWPTSLPGDPSGEIPS